MTQTRAEFLEWPACALCRVALSLNPGLEWADDPADNLCHECAMKEVGRLTTTLTLAQQEARAAALEERDQEWRDASGRAARCDVGWTYCGTCESCAPLRALLEGK